MRDYRSVGDDLEAYRRYVAGIAAASDGTIILNRSYDHATVIIGQLFNKANEEVDILTGELYIPVFGSKEVIQSAIKFLRTHPSGVLKILAEKPIPPTHPLLTSLEKVGVTHRVDLRVLPERLKQTNGFHFAVADGRYFRFERFPSRQDLEAIVQFGEEKVGSRLRQLFADLHKQSPNMTAVAEHT
jgi:hypothetical protein